MSVKKFNLVNISPTLLIKKQPLLQYVFKKYVFFVLWIHFILLVITVFYILFWWRKGYVIILFFKSLAFVRFLLLLGVFCTKIPVDKIYGRPNHYYKRLRHFSLYPCLGWWLLLGFVDLYIFRITIPVVDILYFFIKDKYISIQFLSYLTLDFAYIVEFHLTLYILYNL